MLNRVLVGARSDEDEKVGFSMQMPKSLKDRFDAFCKKNKVTMTAMLQSFMQYTVNVDEGLEEDQKADIPYKYKAKMLSIVEEKLEEKIEELNNFRSGRINDRNPETFDDRCSNEISELVELQKYLLGDKK